MADYGICPMGYNGYVSGWWIFGALIVVVLLFVALYMLLKQSGLQGNRKHGLSPLETLKGRYAKGEITKREYQDMRSELRRER